MFLTDLDLIADPQQDLWTLSKPLIWEDTTFGRLVVPPGFVTDLASIPRIFRNIPFLDPDGVSRRPAAVHDWLYGSVEGRKHGKAFADNFLRWSLMIEGASSAVASTFYFAVHYFGGSGWASDGAKLGE